MKKIILFAIISISSISAKAQSEKKHFDFDTDNSVMVLHTKEISKNKDSLYLLAKKWINATTDYTTPVILVDDQSNGHIQSTCSHAFSTILTVKYKLDIYVKENKYRLYIHDISIDHLDNIEDFTSVYNDYIASDKYHITATSIRDEQIVDDAYRFFSNVQNSLDGAFNEQSDKSVF